uniref:Nephrocystin-3 n=2 Tax=Clytia hemisphaerica TaxID=252671 RepID=A0A7M5VC15_9CNID
PTVATVNATPTVTTGMDPYNICTGQNKLHHRILEAYLEKAREVKRDLFHREFPRNPKDLCRELKKFKKLFKALRSRKEMNYRQFFMLLPNAPHDEVNSLEFDNPMFDFLFKHVCKKVTRPKQGWEKDPDVTDFTNGAHCRRISINRNEVRHGPNYIVKSKFDRIKKSLSDSLLALGVPQAEIDSLGQPIRYGFVNPVSSFTGREKLLQEIYKKVDQSRQTVLQLVIHALAGNGKTELVRRFVHENSKEFEENVLWIKADSEASLSTSFIEIAELLNLDIKEPDGTNKSINYILANVYNYLRDQKVLFVFDDAWDLGVVKKFLPTFKDTTVIITSQKADWPSQDFERIQMLSFSEDESKKLLASQCQSILTDQQIQEIIKLAGGHPLTLQQFITALNRSLLNPNELIATFKEEKAHLLQRNVSSLPEGLSAIAGVRINVRRCSNEVGDGELAIEILKRLCLLETEQIPLSVVEILTAGESKLEVDSALCQLESMSLITKRKSNQREYIVTIHSLIQATILDMIKDRKAEYLNECLKLFFQEIDREKKSFSIHHTNFGRKYFNHIVKIISSKGADGNLYRMIAEKISDIENIMLAKAEYERISQITDTLLTSCTFDTETQLTIQKLSASSLFKQGKYIIARQTYEIILSEETETIGSEHSNTLLTNQQIAICYLWQGKYDIAKSILEKNLSKQNGVLGPLHVESLTTLHYIAVCHNEKGKYDKALKIHQEVLDKEIQVLGDHHPDTLTTKHNIGFCYDNMGDYEQALKIYQEVLDKRIQVLGDHHPNTLGTKHNIGILYRKKGDNEQALKIYQEVLDKEIQVLGDHHPNTLLTKHNIGICYDKMGDYEQALKIYQEVLDKRIQVLGDHHPDTLRTKNNISVCYDKMGDYKGALEIDEEVLKKRVEVLGPDHPDTNISRENLRIARNRIRKQEEKCTIS